MIIIVKKCVYYPTLVLFCVQFFGGFLLDLIAFCRAFDTTDWLLQYGQTEQKREVTTPIFNSMRPRCYCNILQY